MIRTFLLTLLAQLFFLFCVAHAQVPCKAPEIVSNRNNTNIFSEEQEMHLGEIMAETVEKNFVVIADHQATSRLRQIGERLVKHLPPSNIKFQFFVVDAPEFNAFNLAGGRIYVTRKLISFVKSEDELAGIIGHELGHGIVRHHSSDVSRAFKEILSIDRVGDRADIYEKFNQFLDRQRTKRLKASRGHESAQQLEADRIGLYAMVAAGYDPTAAATAWERINELKGKTGNSFGDLFGTTKPEEKRLREILTAIGSVPAECRDRREVGDAAAFAQWQSYVVSIVKVQHKETFKGLISRGSLRPYLQSGVNHFQFSPDGKYVLAQDASGISVISRDPFKFLFRIHAKNAKPARFTPDSENFVFQTFGLRVEVWDIANRKPVLTREVYVRDPCFQTALSPDGKILVCYSTREDLNLIDVETNNKILTKERFYSPNFFELIAWRFSNFAGESGEITPLSLEFSPDGKYLLAGRVFRLSFGNSSLGGAFYLRGLESIQEAFIAYDLSAKKEIKLPSSLRSVVSMPFAFYSNDRIIGQHRSDPEKSGLFTFPGGERVEQFYLNANSYEKPHKGDYIFVRPTRDRPVGVYSVPEKKFLMTNKRAALDGYGDEFVAETTDGRVELFKVKDAKIEVVGRASLPKTELGELWSVSVSGSIDRLAISVSDRSGVWDLSSTAQGEGKFFVDNYHGSYIDSKGQVYADFPADDKQPRSMKKLDPATGAWSNLDPITTRNTQQVGRFLLRSKTKYDEELEKRMAEQKKDGKDAVKDPRSSISFSIGSLPPGFSQNPETTLEVYDAVGRSLLWSRKFPNEEPSYDLDSRAETVAFYWRVATKAAKEMIKASPELSAKLKTMGEKEGDYLVQVVHAATGAPLGQMLLETGEGSFSIRRVVARGDWVAVLDSENRVLFYSLKEGILKSRVFGSSVLLNASRSIGIVENVDGILAVVDLDTGKRIDDLRFPSSISYATLSADENKMFVLTENQQYYIFDLNAYSTPVAMHPPQRGAEVVVGAVK